MRVVAIRGCNLASLSGEFAVELDRPPLSSLGLFAIHGPVGAGKSTLLDALCLGLYGRTPRLSGVGGAPVGDPHAEGGDELRSNDPRTLVRRGASLAFAEVDFTGLDGRLYRARWEVKRSKPRGAKVVGAAAGDRARSGRLQGEKMTLLDVVNGQRVGDTNTSVREAVEARLGLSFDELCRSVLLAQGGFQGFLQARPAERGELLEKVTGTALYSRLSIAAHERARKLREGEHALVVARAALHVLDDAERAERNVAAVRASFEACAAEDEAARCASELERARTALARARAVDEASKAAVRARAQASSSEERLQRAIDAAATSTALRDRLRPLLEQARLLDARLQASSASMAQPEHARAVAAAEAARQAVVTTQGRLDEATARQSAAAAALDDDAALAAVRAFVDVKDAVVAGLQRLERARTDVEGAQVFLAMASRAVTDADVVVSEAERAWRAAVPVRPTVLVGQSLEAVLARLLRRIVVDEEQAQIRLSADVDVARRVRDRLSKALSKAEERALLEDGEPCPLCGSPDHPFAHEAPINAAVGEETARIAALEAEQRKSLERLFNARQGLRALSKHAAADDAPVDAVLDSVDVALVEGLIAREKIAAEAARAVDDARADREERVRAEAFQREALAAKEAAVVDVESHLLGLGLRPADLEQPKARARAIAADIGRFEKARAAAAAAAADVARHAQEHAAAVVRAELAAAARAAAHDAFVAWQAEHQELVSERRVLLDDDVAAVEARLEGARAEAERAVDEARAARSQAASALASAAAVLEERLAQGEGSLDVDVAAAEATCAAARARALQAREQHAVLRAALNHDAQLVDRARALDEQLEAHRASSKVWWELSQVIGSADGARFRQFAQGLTLDALVVHANEHLKTLAPRYRLQRVAVTNARHDLDLVVVDTESGDEVRSTATLSGGESFLVSLSLALGLSSLSANEGARGRVETLFIDEGFSALDAETLDVALTAFDALRQTGRQIGVISHVPLLVERIGAQVRVIPTGGGASRVEVRAG